MPTYNVVLTDKSATDKLAPITATVEAEDIFAAVTKAIRQAPRGRRWTAKAKYNSTRPVDSEPQHD